MDASGRVFGFKKLRVRVRNVTMTDANGNPTLLDAGSGTFVPQDMHAGVDSSGNPTGRLVAIARYHRNPCYQPDLSGEYVTMPNPTTGVPDPTDRRVPSGCSLEETRSALQEISVSAPVALDVSGNLPGNTSGAINPCINVGNVNTGTHAAGADCESESVLAEFDFPRIRYQSTQPTCFCKWRTAGRSGLRKMGSPLEPRIWSSPIIYRVGMERIGSISMAIGFRRQIFLNFRLGTLGRRQRWIP